MFSLFLSPKDDLKKCIEIKKKNYYENSKLSSFSHYFASRGCPLMTGTLVIEVMRQNVTECDIRVMEYRLVQGSQTQIDLVAA